MATVNGMLAPQPGRLSVVAALPWVVWAGLRLTGTERGFPLVPAMSFTPYAAASAVLPLALSARYRSPAGAVLSASAGIALTGAVLARGRRPPGGPPAGGTRVRIATVSLRRGLVAAAPVLDLVRRHDVDVLAVQELTPRAEAALQAAGLGDLLPSAHVLPARPGSPEAASGAIWTRLALRSRATTPGVFEQPTARLAAACGTEFEVTSVHTLPPATSPAAVRGWTADLAALPDPGPEVLRVLAGDFNATLDHAAFRSVLRRGYTDAARAAGRALAWTWRPLHLRFPRLTLDHVLVDPRIAVAGVELAAVRGSDHRAVVAELVLPFR
ncbi:MAG: Metal-dependent hydrolase [Blastococcus sp.]|nr:Metal-dependent hydrolase [Blastococcus sp.]